MRRAECGWAVCLILILELGGALAGATAARAAGVGMAPDGVRHIPNGPVPAHGLRTLTLEPVWKAGGEEDEVFFGMITQIVEDEAGNLYVLDSQLAVVQVFAPDGRHLGTLSRQGEGPGESINPCDLIYLPDRTLGIVQNLPGKIIRIGVDGTPRDSYRSVDAAGGAILAFANAQVRGGNLVIAGVEITTDMTAQRQVKRNFLAGFDEGAVRCVYREEETVIDFRNAVVSEQGEKFVFNRWCLDNAGRVAVASGWDDYEVLVYAPDGQMAQVITREYEPLPKSERERRMMEEALAAARRQQPLPFRYDDEPNCASVRELHFAGNGELWVLPSRGVVDQPAGVMATYDVFDTAGRFDRQVRVSCDGDGEDDLLMFTRNGSVVLVKGFLAGALRTQNLSTDDDAEPMQIVCCRATGG